MMEANEVYKEYLGEGYVSTVRLILGADEMLCPKDMVNADLNIGAMKMMMADVFDQKPMLFASVTTEKKMKMINTAALYYLASILCVALASRTAVPPFNTFRYKKNWDKKRKKCVDKANGLLARLLKMG